MKKVKIMLTAITVLAVVGGALAFKVRKVNGTLYCSTVSGTGGGVCGTNAPRYTVNNGTISRYCVDSPSSTTTPCPDTKTAKLVVDSY